MKILYASSEAVPFCKTGGLADVAGSLPAALAGEGAEIAAVIPLYRTVRERFGREMEFVCYDYVDLAWRHSYCGVFRIKKDGVTWFFLDNEQYFNRPDLYGYLDDGERFGFFSRAVVQMLPHLGFWPDVIHCNDWQTALIPIYLKDDGVREERYRSIRSVMTIHNVEYQGRYGTEVLGDLFGLDHGWADDGTILMEGDVNLLKGAVLCADAVTAVSPSYSEELKHAYFAHGMENILRRCGYKLSGVLNGIDTNRYDPETDAALSVNYSPADLSGKAADKAELQRMLGLREEPDTPVIGVVSRLVAHKGLDLICEVLHDVMELPVQMVVLGKGDKKYEEFFIWAQGQYPGRIAVRLDYSESLAMAIYAGADLFLMPSKSEPCGLSQMIAMRYGTVPIVRETGGLKDTVHPYEAWRDAGNGFTFAGYNSGDMLFVIRQAVGLYRDSPDRFRRLQLRAMAGDFSWSRSAGEYLRIYSSVTGLPKPVKKAAPSAPAAEPKKNSSVISAEKQALPLETDGDVQADGPAPDTIKPEAPAVTEPAAEPEPAMAQPAAEPEPAMAQSAVEPEPAKVQPVVEPEPAMAQSAAEPEPAIAEPSAKKPTRTRRTSAAKPASGAPEKKTGRKKPAVKKSTAKKGTAAVKKKTAAKETV